MTTRHKCVSAILGLRIAEVPRQKAQTLLMQI